jgi:hypothetical protein
MAAESSVQALASGSYTWRSLRPSAQDGRRRVCYTQGGLCACGRTHGWLLHVWLACRRSLHSSRISGDVNVDCLGFRFRAAELFKAAEYAESLL